MVKEQLKTKGRKIKENKTMRKKLSDRVKYLKKVLKTPYHFFTAVDGPTRVSPKGVMIIFEDKNGKRFSFSEKSINDSIKEAERYVKEEIKAGALKEPKKSK